MADHEQKIEPISFYIKRVKEIYFSLNETLYVADPKKIVKIELSQLLQISEDYTMVNFIMGAYLHYVESPPDQKLAEIKVQNLFEVSRLKSFMDKDGNVSLPSNLLVSIIGPSISHLRALFSKNLAGTPYQEVLLPITNPTDVAKHFFSNSFLERPTFFAKDTEPAKDIK